MSVSWIITLFFWANAITCCCLYFSGWDGKLRDVIYKTTYWITLGCIWLSVLIYVFYQMVN